MTAQTPQDEQATRPDPFASVADALREAIHSADEGAAKSKAKDQPKASAPDVMHSLSRFAYTGSYMVAYGVVYASVFVAKSLPQDNPVMEGFIDGGKAAIDAVNDAKGAKADTPAGEMAA